MSNRLVLKAQSAVISWLKLAKFAAPTTARLIFKRLSLSYSDSLSFQASSQTFDYGEWQTSKGSRATARSNIRRRKIIRQRIHRIEGNVV